MRKLLSLCALVALPGLVGIVTPARADEPNGAQVVDACEGVVDHSPQGGERTCRSIEQGLRAGAQLCRHAGADPRCDHLDGSGIDAAEVDAYEGSWVDRALALQRDLSAPVPLRLSLLPHTHNSYNSAAYTPTVSRLDHNQVHTMTDQLRMGIRAIEIDVHLAPNAAEGRPAPTTCHAQAQGGVHAGCTTEGTLLEALEEVEGWFEQPGNDDEVVLLYLENALDGDADAHDEAVAAIDATIGHRVLRPSAGSPCDDLPIDLSVDDVRSAGKQVLLTGNCGPGAWGGWVFERGDRWDEGSSGEGDDYPAAPGCADRSRLDYDDHLVRTWEDATWLSFMVNGRGSDVTPTEVESMVRCGMNLVGFDLLRPFDGRLRALVWSWAPDEPATDGCARRTSDGFRSGDCSVPRPFACATSAGWVVSSATGAWSDGDAACASVGGTFAVPRTGRDDMALGSTLGGTEPWLDYRSDGTGRWVS